MSNLTKLAASASPWERHPTAFLDSYLVQETENPGINAHSVLLRAMLADSLFPGKFDALICDEMLYSAAAMSLLTCARQGRFRSLRDELTGLAPPSAETPPPTFLTAELPFSLPDLLGALEHALAVGFDAFETPFAARWRDALAPCETLPAAVLELGCGSANDSRYFPRYGLARFVRYTGCDLTPKNIANAQSRYPDGNFLVADAAALPFPDAAFDYTFACDLLEHLRKPNLERALREALRVTRKELWLSFFNVDWLPAHEFGEAHGRPLNTLSRRALTRFFEKRGLVSHWVDISHEWPERFSGYRHYNPNACLLFVRVGES
jgi:SAM-dependent methyltransferase